MTTDRICYVYLCESERILSSCRRVTLHQNTHKLKKEKKRKSETGYYKALYLLFTVADDHIITNYFKLKLSYTNYQLAVWLRIYC